MMIEGAESSHERRDAVPIARALSPPIARVPAGVVGRRFLQSRFVAVSVIVIAIVVIWYVAAWLLNAPFQRELDARAEIEPTFAEFVELTWSQERPVLPSPHQVGQEL